MLENIPGTFMMVYGAVQAGAVVPIVRQLVKFLPGTLPVQAKLYTGGLSLLAAWLLAMWLAPELTRDDLLTVTLAGYATSDATNASARTIGKVVKK